MNRYIVPALLCCLMPTTLSAQAPPDFGFGGFGGDDAPGELQVSAELEAVDVGILDLKVTVELPADNYIYSATTPFGIKTAVEVTTDGVAKSGGLTSDRAPKVVVDKIIDATMEKFFTKVTWTQRLKVSGNITAASTISGTLTGQYCNDATHLCIPIDPPEKFEATVPTNYVAPEIAATRAYWISMGVILESTFAGRVDGQQFDHHRFFSNSLLGFYDGNFQVETKHRR